MTLTLETLIATVKAGDFYCGGDRIEHMADHETTELFAANFLGVDFEPCTLADAWDRTEDFELIPEGHPLFDRCCAWLMQAKLQDAPVHVPGLREIIEGACK